jgi:hypothetical protein
MMGQIFYMQSIRGNYGLVRLILMSPSAAADIAGGKLSGAVDLITAR